MNGSTYWYPGYLRFSDHFLQNSRITSEENVVYTTEVTGMCTLVVVKLFVDSSSGAPGPGAAVARGHGGVTDVGRSHGGEAEG